MEVDIFGWFLFFVVFFFYDSFVIFVFWGYSATGWYEGLVGLFEKNVLFIGLYLWLFIVANDWME